MDKGQSRWGWGRVWHPCVCESQGRAGSRSSGVLGMLRNTQCYQSDPRDTGQWIAPKKEVILLQCKAGWAHMCWPSSLPSEELQHLDMGTWLPGRGWEGLTTTWSSLCRFSSKAILKEDYMDQLLMNACRQLSSWDGFGNVAPRAGLASFPGVKWRVEKLGLNCCSILLACSKASVQ